MSAKCVWTEDGKEPLEFAVPDVFLSAMNEEAAKYTKPVIDPDTGLTRQMSMYTSGIAMLAARVQAQIVRPMVEAWLRAHPDPNVTAMESAITAAESESMVLQSKLAKLRKDLESYKSTAVFSVSVQTVTPTPPSS